MYIFSKNIIFLENYDFKYMSNETSVYKIITQQRGKDATIYFEIFKYRYKYAFF